MCWSRLLNKHERAAFIVRNALHGRRIALPTPTSVWAQRVYHNRIYRFIYVICMITLMLLAVWEKPSKLDVPESAHVAAKVIDALLLLLVFGDLILQRCYHGIKFWTIGWIHIKLVVYAALVLNYIIHVSNPDSYVYVTRILRPILLIERLRNVRRVALNIASTLPKILNVVILLSIHMLFFTVLGFVLFAGVTGKDPDTGEMACSVRRTAQPPTCSTFGNGDCRDYFASLDNSGMQLFGLLTGANFPVIALPAYECTPFAMIYFIAFIAIGIYLLLNLTLAVTYATFKNSMAAEVVQKYERMFLGFDLAFEEIVNPGTDTMRVESVRAASAGRRSSTRRVANPLAAGDGMRATADGLGPSVELSAINPKVVDSGMKKEDFVDFFVVVRPDVARQCAGMFFDIFDVDRRGIIYPDEFRRLLLNFARLSIRKHDHSGSRGSITGGNRLTRVEAAPALAGAENSLSPIVGVGEDSDEDEVEVLDSSLEAPAVGEPPRQRSSLTLIGSLARESSLVHRTHVVQTREHASEEVRDAAKPETALVQNVMRAVGTNIPSSAASSNPNPLRQCCRALQSSIMEGLSLRTRIDGHGIASWSRRMTSQERALSAREKLASFIEWLPITLLCDAIVLLNTVAVMVQMSNEYDSAYPLVSPHQNDLAISMRTLQYWLLGFFSVEIALKTVAFGPARYWRSSLASKVDIFIVIAAIIGTILEVSEVVSRQVSAVISFFRFIRLIRILRIVPGFGLTLAAFSDIIPVMVQYATVLICCMYSFSVLGMVCFAGVLDPASEVVQRSSYGQNDLYALNFDTLHGAFFCDLYLLVLNDWPALMDGCEAVLGKASRLYFFAFWLTHTVIVLNVLIAFVIDSFSTQKVKRETLQLVHDKKLDPSFGLDDWRRLILNSGLDFSEFRISKAAHHFDVYDELYKEEVSDRFASTFETTRIPLQRPIT